MRASARQGVLALLLALMSGAAAWWAQPARAAELVLATWNLEHLAARDGAGCRPRQDADYRALRAQAERLEATVVAVQEVENAEAVARVFDPDRYAFEVSRRPETRAGVCRESSAQRHRAQRTGFAIHRERLAALGLRYRRLADVEALGGPGGRWGTRIELRPRDADAPRLELLAVHLKAGCAWGALDGKHGGRSRDCRALRQQRGVLEEWIDARAAADRPFVLLGDFNRQLDQPKDHFWRAIDDAEVCAWQADPDLGRRCRVGSARPDPDADLTLANAGVPFRFARNRKFPFAIDHFVFDGQSATWVKRDSYRAFADPDPRASLSDHHALRVALRWPDSR